MRLRNVFLCAFTLASMLTFAGCQTAPAPEPKRDAAADIAAVNGLIDQFNITCSSNDATALAALHDDNAIEMRANQADIEGRQAIQTWLEGMFKEYAIKCALTPLETQVAGDWAFQRGNSTFTITPKSGKPIEESGKYLNIYKRQPDDSWKMYREISNGNEPSPITAGKKK